MPLTTRGCTRPRSFVRGDRQVVGAPARIRLHPLAEIFAWTKAWPSSAVEAIAECCLDNERGRNPAIKNFSRNLMCFQEHFLLPIELTLSPRTFTTARIRNLLSQSPRFLLKPAVADALLAAMHECVRARWYATARACGVTEADCETIIAAFLYKGFFHQNGAAI